MPAFVSAAPLGEASLAWMLAQSRMDARPVLTIKEDNGAARQIMKIVPLSDKLSACARNICSAPCKHMFQYIYIYIYTYTYMFTERAPVPMTAPGCRGFLEDDVEQQLARVSLDA